MPVQTGYTDESNLGLGDTPAETQPPESDLPTAPPSPVAGLDAVDAEPRPVGEEGEAQSAPTVTVRDKVFTLRSGVPGMLLMRLAKGQIEVSEAQDDPDKQAMVMAAIGDSITKLVVKGERSAFTNWLEEVDPPVEVPELMALVKEMMGKVAGRPTQSA